jgi:hypothetical protein
MSTPAVTPLSATDLDEMERLAREATPGPWRVTLFTSDIRRELDATAGFIAVVSGSAPALPGKIRVPAICGQPGTPLEAESRADAAFIAACSPERITRLLTALRSGAEMEEALATSEREAAKNWQLYWDLYEPLTTVTHYSIGGVLSHLAREHLRVIFGPGQPPVYGPRGAFAIAAKKGAELLDALQARRKASDEAQSASRTPSTETTP